MRNFKELKIWQKGFEIAVDTYRFTASFPSTKSKAALNEQNGYKMKTEVR